VQQRDYSFPYIVVAPESSAGINQAPMGPASPYHPEWVTTSMYMSVFSYAK
jgi:hypothetical protein